MQKYLIFMFVIFSYLSLLQAQPSIAVHVMETVNNKLTSIEQGYFDCTYQWKSSLKTDTSSKSARVYFFKDKSNLDSICRFVMLRDGRLDEAYDGTNFHYIDHENRTISYYPVSEKGGVVKVLRKNYHDMLIFRPYIMEKQAFRLSRFKNAFIDTFDIPTGKAVRITVLDSFVNELKSLPSDPSMAQVKEVYEISLQDTMLFKKQEIIKFLALPQYLENNLSPIQALPDSVTFEKIFNIPFLMSNEYSLKKISKTGIQQEPPPLIKVGDTIPNFALVDLEGQETALYVNTDGLILLDFWYMSCAPCIMAMPVIERLHQKYKDKGLSVLGINGFDKNPATIKSFMKERAVAYQTLLDTNRKLAEQLQIRGYPTILLIEAKSHKVLMAHSGFSLEIESKVSEFMEERLKGN